MMIERVKTMLKSKKGEKLKFKINGSRNQIEEFSGEIVSLYNSIFTVKDDKNIMRSFTYSDVITKNLVIYKN